MASKHSAEASGPSKNAQKKPRHGFRVGPENLPDGPWKRKVDRIKKQLIHKAKVKKAYAKIKEREQPNLAKDLKPYQAEEAEKSEEEAEDAEESGEDAGEDQETPKEKMHPTRHLMLKDEDNAQAGAGKGDRDPSGAVSRDGERRRTRRPGYYDKQLQKADERRVEAEERAREIQQRREERARKLAERERFKKAMAKTRDKDGKKKLGRESVLLLDKVKKMMAEK
ncbi:hypothetical protein B0I35DRAFT_16630 [Stachybotrys elegans]|uniref:rRNA-processing protein FYV7 n=1 Tax=Stachybotrys elegans TaxID=80388 RepID=A0A8K0SYD0_9HYPO|nr:hypothetical protein B0I35DRAFT_16630 [Stachybotrys elegans]